MAEICGSKPCEPKKVRIFAHETKTVQNSFPIYCDKGRKRPGSKWAKPLKYNGTGKKNRKFCLISDRIRQEKTIGIIFALII